MSERQMLKVLVVLTALSTVSASCFEAASIEYDEVSLLQKTATVEISGKRNERGGNHDAKQNMSPEEEGFEEALKEYHNAKQKAYHARQLKDQEMVRQAAAKAR